MRAALSLKPNNSTTNSSHGNINKVSLKNESLGGKLTRQVGTSNLLREMKPSMKSEESPLIKCSVKENFEVFEDQEPEKEVSENDNNMIHELERKMEQKTREVEQRKNFLLARENSDFMSRCSEPPSEALSVSTVYEDDDFDKHSVASSTFTTTVRASFSSFHFDRKSKEEETFKATSVIQRKAGKEERDDAMFASDEYFDDIYKYMSHRQTKFRASHKLFARQEQVNEEMRTILIDWFNDVVKEYRLQQETFHLAVSLVDRVLSHLSVDKIQFQLVGTTSLMIAAKYEEIFPPEIGEFAIITDNTYRVDEILQMERFLLPKLKYIVATPTPVWFGTCFAKRMNYTTKMNKTMSYLLDLSMIDVDFLRYRQSDIAAAAACFTNLQAGREAWPQKIIDDTGINTEDFVDVLKDLHRVYLNASTADYKSIFNKYCEVDEKEVALAPAPTDKLYELFPSVFSARTTDSK